VRLHDVAYWFGEWQQKKDPEILRKFVLPMETTLTLIPKIAVRDSAVDALCHGANLTAPGVLSAETGITKGTMIAVLTMKGEAIALAKALLSTEEIIDLRHGTVATLQRVVMPRGTYPKVWKSGNQK
jgi:H/ACA ribonucleoprotein complex subunit 4